MTLEEIVEFCADEDNLRFTFDHSVFWLFQSVPNFFSIIEDTVYAWDLYIEKYVEGETITVYVEDGIVHERIPYAVEIRFDAATRCFVVSF